MKLIKMLAVTGIIGVASMGLTGCMTAPFMPPMGAFTDISAPLDLEYDQTNIKSTKVGESSATCILGLIATGDASSQAAARQGQIKTIQHADYGYYNVLGVYQKTTVKVYGE